jgi:hypothetical protein
MGTTKTTYFVTGDGLEGRLHDNYSGKAAASIARRLFGRDAYCLPGEFVAWVDVYLPLKQRDTRDHRKIITNGRVWVGTMRPVSA